MKLATIHKKKMIRFYMTIMWLTLSILTYGQLDTIKFKPHTITKSELTDIDSISRDSQLVKIIIKFKTIYTVDNKKVNKKKYDQALRESEGINRCNPCWLKHYDNKGNLVQEGISYNSECSLGKVTYYYSNGKIKSIRYYKTNDTNDWKNYPCSIPEGTWTYYDKENKIEKIEIYKNGQLAETKSIKIE